MYCTECGTSMALQAKFCRECGTAADRREGAADVPDRKEQTGDSSAADGIPPAVVVETQPLSQGDVYRALVGDKNRAVYVQAFLALDKDKKAATPWNWAAFFGMFWWLLYRRMWRNAAICYFLWLSIATVFTWELQGAESPWLVAGGWLLVSFFMCVIAGGAGTEIYYSHCKKILNRQMKEGTVTVQTLEKAGGVSRWAPLAVLAVNAMLSSMLGWAISQSSAYRAYETRAQLETSVGSTATESLGRQNVQAKPSIAADIREPAANRIGSSSE